MSVNTLPPEIHLTSGFVPELREKTSFRIFDENPTSDAGLQVKRTYYNMHTNQTVAYVQEQHEKWCKFNTAEVGMMEALEMLSNFLDESDPDVDVPNLVHAYQTAERVREKHPEEDWFHLVGLIHDVGKVMNCYGQEQWSTVGDTFPVGLAPRKSIVFAPDSFANSPDIKDSRYNTELGIYEKHCGLDQVMLSWGHDEYLYRVLKNHPECRIPLPGLWCIRYHSFYPWHDSGDYRDLCDESDELKLKWINEFNQFDLYSKGDNLPDIDTLKPYYESLIEKYIPGKIKF